MNSTVKVNNKDIVRRLTAGSPTKYNKDRHIELLYTVFSGGEGREAFCAEALISQKTFYNWLNVHKEFRETYEIVLNMAERIWAQYPLEDRNINYIYWHSIMKNRFGYGKARFKFSKEKTPLNIINDVLNGLENGEISVDEALKISNLAITKSNIKNDEILTNQTGAFSQNREILLAKVEEITRIIDHLKENE